MLAASGVNSFPKKMHVHIRNEEQIHLVHVLSRGTAFWATTMGESLARLPFKAALVPTQLLKGCRGGSREGEWGVATAIARKYCMVMCP